MKSYISYILCWLLLSISFLTSTNITHAWAVPFDKIQNFNDEIKKNTLTTTVSTGEDPVQTIEDASQSILTTIKTILSWLMVIYVVYAGIQMVISRWTDEDSLSSGKRQLWYTIIAFVFINIPGAVFNAFDSTAKQVVGTKTTYSSWFKTPGQEWNLFYDAFSLWNTLNNDIIGFMEILISFIAIAIIIIAWFRIIKSRGDEEKMKEQKDKIIWSIVSLILVWFIESWKFLVFKWEIEDGTSFFETITNLLFFFAGPVAIWFLTYAAYTYITANWDEEKVKKGKSIVVNVVLATVILLASYTFLLDLITL